MSGSRPLLALGFFCLLLSASIARAQVSFQSQWSPSGSPIDLATDVQGNVYVTVNEFVRKFSKNGTLIGQWGGAGTGAGRFSIPRGICLDAAGNVYVVDDGAANDRVEVFTSTGVFLRSWGSTGFGPGQFYNPSGIEVDAAGFVYVTEVDGHRVQKFASDGTFIQQWVTPVGMDPYGVVVDGQGRVFVTTLYSVRRYTSDGILEREWGSFGSAPGQFNQIFGIAVDALGVLYVTDRYNFRVQMFSGDGAFLGLFGSYGVGPGQFNFPWGVNADASGSGKIYVADPYLSRVEVFAPGVTAIPNVSWGQIKARYR